MTESRPPTRAQPGIFEEDHEHHVFLEWTLPESVDAAAKAALGELADRACTKADPDLVLALGPRAMRTLLPDALPEELADFRAISGVEGYSAPSTQRDLFVWAHGTRRDLVFKHALEAHAVLATAFELDLEVPAFRYLDSRDLTGFIDGSANPKDDARMEAALVAAGSSAGGSFVFTQQWIHDLGKWGAISEGEQERIIGRTKPDSIELEGDDMPPDSHVSRTDVKIDGEAMKIWRRSVPFGSVREHGLYFLAFACHPERFQVQLDRMFGVSGDGVHDRLIEFSTPVTGSYWFAPSIDALRTAFA